MGMLNINYKLIQYDDNCYSSRKTAIFIDSCDCLLRFKTYTRIWLIQWLDTRMLKEGHQLVIICKSSDKTIQKSILISINKLDYYVR